MTRKEFLTALEQYLVTLSAEEKADIISDYEEHFRVGLENGKTEAEIAATLGSPYDVASQFLDGEPPKNYHQRPNYGAQQGYQQEPNYNAQQNYQQRPNYNSQQNYQQRPNYNSQQNYQQRPNYNSQQNYQQRSNCNPQQGYSTQQNYRQEQNHTAQQNYQQQNPDAYSVPYERPDYAPQSGSRYNTTGIIVVVVLCVVLIPTLGSTLVGLLVGLYGSVIGFAVSGVALITTGAALTPGMSLWVCVGLILLGVSFIALTGLLVMASIEGTKLFIKLIKYCIKECRKMITEGTF